MQLNGTNPFQFDEMPTLERVENNQLNANNHAIENIIIFHYFSFSKKKLMKCSFQFLISWQALIYQSFQNEKKSLFFSNADAIRVFKRCKSWWCNKLEFHTFSWNNETNFLHTIFQWKCFLDYELFKKMKTWKEKFIQINGTLTLPNTRPTI